MVRSKKHYGRLVSKVLNEKLTKIAAVVKMSSPPRRSNGIIGDQTVSVFVSLRRYFFWSWEFVPARTLRKVILFKVMFHAPRSVSDILYSKLKLKVVPEANLTISDCVNFLRPGRSHLNETVCQVSSPGRYAFPRYKREKFCCYGPFRGKNGTSMHWICYSIKGCIYIAISIASDSINNCAKTKWFGKLSLFIICWSLINLKPILKGDIK